MIKTNSKLNFVEVIFTVHSSLSNHCAFNSGNKRNKNHFEYISIGSLVLLMNCCRCRKSSFIKFISFSYSLLLNSTVSGMRDLSLRVYLSLQSVFPLILIVESVQILLQTSSITAHTSVLLSIRKKT